MGMDFKQAGKDFKAVMSGLNSAINNAEELIKQELGEKKYKEWVKISEKYKELIGKGRITEANAIMNKFKKENG